MSGLPTADSTGDSFGDSSGLSTADSTGDSTGDPTADSTGDHTVYGASEVELLAAAAAGDGQAVRWLLDEVAPVVYGFIYARVGGNQHMAEDLLQDTLLEAMRGAGTFRGEAAATTWACAIARRRLARFYESERRRETAQRSLRLVPGGAGDPADALVNRQDEVVRALGRLPALQRQALVLKYMEDLSVEDIAKELNRGRIQVQSLLQRGRESLRRALGGADA